MTAPDEITVAVWTRLSGATWARVGRVTSWKALSDESRLLQPGPWSLTLPYDPQTAKITKLHLITIDFRGLRTTGVIEHLGPGSDENGQVALDLSGVDALTLLGDALCWPAPTDPLGAQSVRWYRATGAAETVLTDLIRANLVTRRGDPITVAASQGRGSSVILHERFTNLLQIVAAKCDLAGLRPRVGLVGDPDSTRAQLTCWFDLPADRSARVKLSHPAGTLRTWAQSDDAPTGTRAIIGGGGQGLARVFRQVTQPAAETEWGRRREVFTDARDVEVETDAAKVTAMNAELDERGQSDLAEAAAQSSFDLETADAAGMRYGTHYQVGDKVTVSLLTGVTKVDRVSSAVLTADEQGVSVKVVPGNPDAGKPLFAQAAIVRAIRQQVRKLQQEDE